MLTGDAAPPGEAALSALFRQLGFDPVIHRHPPVATVAEAEAHWRDIEAMPVKNLFLKDAGGQHWLVVVPAERRVDLKTLPARIGAKRLRFASAEDLLALLGLTPGAVSPLAVVNDTVGRARVALDQGLETSKPLALHPLTNTATIAMPYDRLVRFLQMAAHAPVPFTQE